MSIGKNALKRVENNGYSKVKSSAPDMENSEVVEKVVVDLQGEKKVERVPAPKKTAKTTNCTELKVVKPRKPRVKKEEENSGFKTVAVGSELPYYLL